MFKKGYTPWNKGKIGIKCGAKKGNIPWNKGLTKEKDLRVALYGKNSGLSRIGKSSWCKGLNKLTDKRLKEAGKKISKVHKIAFKNGRISWNKGIHMWKDKIHPHMNKHLYWLLKEKHPQWKGGVTPINIMIRNSLENKQWIKKVFERDYYTCQKCNNESHNSIAHHKKSFSLILKEFLQEYNQFSPLEDKETLMRLAINYKPFWDINNGQTLCKECHDKITYGGILCQFQ